MGWYPYIVLMVIEPPPIYDRLTFATHFAKIYGDCKNSNEVKAKLKESISVEVIWQGDVIKYTKSARTRKCKL